MSENGYWSRVMLSRLSRRRAIAGAATVGAGAAALSVIGCGGGGDGGGGGGGQATTDKPQDTTAQAKAGGVYRIIQTADPVNLDPNRSTSFTAQEVGARVYSRLLKFQTGPDITPLSKTTGDAAESFEVNADATQWTFKLRKGMKFHPKGPASVNGRDLTAEDVKASYDYFLERNGNKAILVDIVDKMETPDNSTVVFKLKKQYAPFQELMASSALFWIMSKQGATGELDTQKVEGVIGTGPWILDSQTPSVEINFKRHPNWYEKARISTGEVSLPILDGHTHVNMPDYAQQQAQFIAGNIMAFAVRNPDLADVTRQKADAQKLGVPPGWLLSMFYFKLDNPNNPFRDERLRRALSMAIDRDGIIEVFGEVSKLKSQGFDIPTGWNNACVPWGDGGMFWWLDPKGKDIGAAGQWYKYSVEEAKKLVSAAGYTGQTFTINTTNTIYGTTFDNQTEAHLPMLSAVGFKYDFKSEDYTSKYFPEVYTKFNYEHVAYGYNTPFATVGEYMYRLVHSKGDQNKSRVNDPEIDALVLKQEVETDQNKRQAIIHDIQRKVSDKMYYVPTVVGRWGSFTLFAPYVRNFGSFRTAAYGTSVESYPRYWLDRA
ncbi:MAG TPA: ABC transporter substrate-binding protein [Dehalococcoidia bacterium]|nr:ABC transporter substrate-binding protein [Dehalococcoidia bacterium]